jgi:hypothetical protein
MRNLSSQGIVSSAAAVVQQQEQTNMQTLLISSETVHSQRNCSPQLRRHIKEQLLQDQEQFEE